MIAMTVLLLALSISFIIPCNTALCILFEQFDGSNVKTASKSRCVMWFLASISTLTFSKTLYTYGFTVSFFPYFMISVISYVVMRIK
uniref:Serpentine receptor class gamma n=1 Tax=Caenorhabditis japonica TaxID=281687 RepID=A0A8R1E8H3_CAEJA